MSKTCIVTGGCGVIGSNIVEHLHRKTNWKIIIIDMLSYASKGFNRIRDMGILSSDRIKIFTWDLCNPISPGLQIEIGEDVNYIIHTAASTHIDASIIDPVPFVMNNVKSTLEILEYARKCKNLELFFMFSTDEVFSAAPKGVSYKETDRHKPTNPYSASKSASEMLTIAYGNTYNLPTIRVNCMNAISERQDVEKFVPKCIKYILEGKELDIHCDENLEPGSRIYIHARNIAAAVLFLVNKGTIGEAYNIVGEREVDNLEMAQFIAKVMGKELNYKLNSSPRGGGHDLRYSLDGNKLFNLGFKLPINFEESLTHVVQWTLEHPEWLE